MRRQPPFGLNVIIASVAGTAAILVYSWLMGFLRPSQSIFLTPIPYALLFVTLFGVSPAYVMLQPWVRLRPLRFLLVALAIGGVLYWWRGAMWNWHPAFVGRWENVAFFIGAPVAGAAAYWAILRWLAPEWDEAP